MLNFSWKKEIIRYRSTGVECVGDCCVLRVEDCYVFTTAGSSSCGHGGLKVVSLRAGALLTNLTCIHSPALKKSVSNNRKGVYSKIKLFVAAVFVPTLDL